MQIRANACKIWANTTKYVQLHANACKYVHIRKLRAITCKHVQTRAKTSKYMQVRLNTHYPALPKISGKRRAPKARAIATCSEYAATDRNTLQNAETGRRGATGRRCKRKQNQPLASKSHTTAWSLLKTYILMGFWVVRRKPRKTRKTSHWLPNRRKLDESW